MAGAPVMPMAASASTGMARALHVGDCLPRDPGRHGSLLRPEAGDQGIRTQRVQGPRDALIRRVRALGVKTTSASVAAWARRWSM